MLIYHFPEDRDMLLAVLPMMWVFSGSAIIAELGYTYLHIELAGSMCSAQCKTRKQISSAVISQPWQWQTWQRSDLLRAVLSVAGQCAVENRA